MSNSLDNLSILLITFDNFKNYYKYDIQECILFEIEKQILSLMEKETYTYEKPYEYQGEDPYIEMKHK